MPAPRSKTTCNQCRARKVRCGGGPCPCANCRRLNFQCSFDENARVATAPTALENRRAVRACCECRSLKIKCSGELPACVGCRSNGKDCTYPELKRTTRRPEGSSPASNCPNAVSPALVGLGSDPTSLTSPESLRQRTGTSATGTSVTAPRSDVFEFCPLPPLRDRLHLVVDFFRHIHPIPFYAFLYEEGTIQRCLEETIDEALIHAICAITALLLGYAKYHPASTASWAAKVESIIWSTLEQPTIFKLQALVLIIEYRIICGNFRRSFMLFSLATRSSTALRLTYERSGLSNAAQEIRRRLMWSLVLMDGHFAVGLPECELCPYEMIHLKLPGPEESFNTESLSESTDVAPLGLDGVAEGGLLGIYIQEFKIRRDLLRLKRELDIASQPVSRLDMIVEDFVKALRQVLPHPYSREDLQRYTRSRWISRYLTVHLSWHQCHCDAYRLFLSGYKESAPPDILSGTSAEYIANAVVQCIYHAQAIISILHDAGALNPRLQVACVEMAICGYHASRLLLFISKSSFNPSDSGITVATALDEAKSTLEIMTRLDSISAVAQLLIKELERLIQYNATGNDQGSRESSGPDDDTCIRQPSYAPTAKQRQFLGVHSILRQARFRDDSALAAQRSGLESSVQLRPAANPGEDGPVILNHAPHFSDFQIWNQMPREAIGSSTVPPLDYPLDLTANEGTGILPPAIFENATLGLEHWVPWQDGSGMNEWGMETDGDYF